MWISFMDDQILFKLLKYARSRKLQSKKKKKLIFSLARMDVEKKKKLKA